MEPFDESNYTMWVFKMKMYLMSKDSCDEQCARIIQSARGFSPYVRHGKSFMAQREVYVVPVYGGRHERTRDKTGTTDSSDERIRLCAKRRGCLCNNLCSLPEFYDSLVQAFRMTVTRFSFNDLVSKLIAEEVRKKDSSNMEEATALHASKRQEQGKFEKKSSQGKKVMSV
ncbi:unnamed protein product [Peronospora belbahrii]|uniref:DUF4219 domain-containing protein n=1 Tax=Peronospora belbahrii TaxID=622444 RepID=A0ABN8CU56_9STRA|nr:unnamed protein product [Peronospora belbahrii]